MKIQRNLAIVLIIFGMAGFVYGGFSYTKETHRADIGSMHFSFSEKGYVNIPVWVGVAFCVAGGLLLITRRKL